MWKISKGSDHYKYFKGGLQLNLRIYLNRLLHRFRIHYCNCGKICLFKNVFGVVNDDCVVCPNCWRKI